MHFVCLHQLPDARLPHGTTAPNQPPSGRLFAFRGRQQYQSRRSKSLSSCYARGRGGWDNLGTPSLRGGAPSPSPSTTSAAAATWADTNASIITDGSGNRRGRCHIPRNSDLGFGSERMRSQLSGDGDQDHRRRGGRRSSSGGVADAGSRRTRSLSLGAERRYGNWARSSVQHLLRQDGWLGVRSPRPTGPSSTTGEPSSGYSSEGKGQHRRRAAAETAVQQTARPRSSPGRRVSNRNNFSDGFVVLNSARHPAQTRERRPSPYATDADFSSATAPLLARATRGVAGRPLDNFSRTHPRAVADVRARNAEPEDWGGTITGGGGKAGGEFSSTLRWGESMRSPQRPSRRQSARTKQAGAPSSNPKAASKTFFY